MLIMPRVMLVHVQLWRVRGIAHACNTEDLAPKTQQRLSILYTSSYLGYKRGYMGQTWSATSSEETKLK